MIMLKQDTSGKTNNWTYLFNKWNYYLKLTARKTLSAAEAIFLSKNLAKLPQANLHSQLLLCMMPWFCCVSTELHFQAKRKHCSPASFTISCSSRSWSQFSWSLSSSQQCPSSVSDVASETSRSVHQELASKLQQSDVWLQSCEEGWRL